MPARFVEVRERDEFLIVDLQGPDPHVVCRCGGWKAPLYAEYVCRALEAYHSNFYNKVMGIAGTGFCDGGQDRD